MQCNALHFDSFRVSTVQYRHINVSSPNQFMVLFLVYLWFNISSSAVYMFMLL